VLGIYISQSLHKSMMVCYFMKEEIGIRGNALSEETYHKVCRSKCVCVGGGGLCVCMYLSVCV
jgi:hypothetical protein